MSHLLEPMRVLIVDDTADDQAFGVSVVTECVPCAQIEFASSYELALPLLIHEYFDLVVMDLVLHSEDPGAEESWEGLWLLQDLVERGLNRYVPIVILSTFSRREISLSLFKSFHIVDVWAKGTSHEDRVASLRLSLTEQNHFGLACEVQFRDGMSWKILAESLGLARRLSSPVSQADAEYELKHIIRKLFADRKRLLISALATENEPGNSGAGVCIVTPFGAEGNQQADLILKFGTFDQISQERAGWTHVARYMQSLRTTHLDDSMFGRHFGALVYSLVGARSGQIKSFGQFYCRASVDQIHQVLKTLFEETCVLWHKSANRSEVRMLSVCDLYCGYLGLTQDDIRKAFDFKYPEQSLELNYLKLRPLPRTFPHPVAAFCAGKADFVMESWNCRTHGDLHTGNILVDTALQEPWLIDFGRAATGHWARDLVALEASVKFQHIPPKDISALFELEAALVKPDHFGESIQYYREDEPELCRAAELIKELRRIAAAIDGRSDTRTALMDYYAALYYQTINYIRFHKLIKSPVRKNQVLLSAALLYEKLTSFLGKA
jgi:CheY-like chemotaxis protein